MPKYKVTIPYACFVTVEVEADNKEDAEDKANDEVYIGSYAGNGGSNKLIGVSEPNMSIEVNEESIEGVDVFSIEVEEVEE